MVGKLAGLIFGTAALGVIAAVSIKSLSEFDEYVDDSSDDEEENTSISKHIRRRCTYKNGCDEDTFISIVREVLDSMERVVSYSIDNGSIRCNILSHTQKTTWECIIDFNDYGVISGDYCLYTDNQNAHFQKVIASELAPKIKYAADQRNIELEKIREKERAIKRAKRLEWKRQHPKLTKYIHIAIVVGISVIIVSILLAVHLTHEKAEQIYQQHIANGDIKITCSSSDFNGDNYKDVQQQLCDMGFKNITTKADHDLVTGWIDDRYSVESVTVDGETFDEDEWINNNASIVITYHERKSSLQFWVD